MQRVICLHGYGQSDEIFRQKASNIIKSLGKKYELVFIKAPHSVKNFQGENTNAWWTYENVNEFFKSTNYLGVEESISLVENHLPFSGIIGFSQGGAFASFLPALFPVDFCITIGAFPVTDPKYSVLYDSVDKTKFYHIYGEKDEIVLPSITKQLHDCCGTDKELLSHNGRHVIPNINYSRLIDTELKE